jgi:hypothetical protein
VDSIDWHGDESGGGEQSVRDLIWAVSSPPLLALGNDVADPPLDRGMIDPAHLAGFLRERADRRVGHYFENLVHYWLKHLRQFEIVAHRQIVNDSERTLGELDFILRDEAGRLMHWEVAIKFYLLTKAADGQTPRYLGPNTTDSLDRKIERLLKHQLPLSERVYGNVETRRAFVKGRIYHPPSAGQGAPGLPELHPSHLKGTWLHRGGFVPFVEKRVPEACAFALLAKPFWLTPPVVRFPIRDLAVTMERSFDGPANARHVALFDTRGAEVQRLFVVPDNWPDLG